MDGEYTLNAAGLYKSFDGKQALGGVSFGVKGNEIFGLLGPNGAGKTTLIRLILNILKPDSGRVELFGGVFNETLKERIGYLPEEGGVYRKTKVFDCIRYFARLKGADGIDSEIDAWLKRLDLWDYRNKNIEDLSKGMHRKLQFIISVVHGPDILILDEPFYGLDPINKRLIKDLILELKNGGMTIIMSTHQMDEVEKMCDRILLINKGKPVLYGTLGEIKSGYGSTVLVEYEGTLPGVPGVSKIDDYGNYAELTLEKDTDTQDILKKLAGSVRIGKFEVKTKSLNEIFIEVVEGG